MQILTRCQGDRCVVNGREGLMAVDFSGRDTATVGVIGRLLMRVTAKGEDEEAAVVKVCFPFFPDFRTTMLRSLLWRCRDDAERDLHRRGEATELLL
ncbi:hypothetical protein BHE74_00007961 [Ensete ventricosum]|nr:hypothetical protein BHE74_00007961 [Ensete ventricosum]